MTDVSRRWILWSAGFVALAALLLAPPAPASEPMTADPLRSQILAMIGGFHHLPDESEWKALPPRAQEILIEIASDPGQPAFKRARAIAALAWFPSPETKTFLTGVIQNRDKFKPMLRRKAVRALLVAYRDEAVPVTTPLLKEDDPLMREAVVEGLGELGTPLALSTLRTHLVLEPESWLRKRMEIHLKKGGAP